jgi:hypothetical protein
VFGNVKLTPKNPKELSGLCKKKFNTGTNPVDFVFMADLVHFRRNKRRYQLWCKMNMIPTTICIY